MPIRRGRCPNRCDSSGDPIDLNALITGTPGGSWQGDGVNNGTFDPNGFSGAIPVTYMATIGSCTAQFTQDIVVLTPPTAMAGPDVGVCGLTAAMSAINVQAQARGPVHLMSLWAAQRTPRPP